MTQNEFGRAMYLALLLYGVEFTDPSDFEEIALNAWGIIGNKNVKLYRYRGKVDENTLSLELPCNCDIIESVTRPGEDWNYTSNVLDNGNYQSKFTEEYIERRKHTMHPLYSHGHYIHYKRIGDKLYFDKPYCDVEILYKGIILDDNGLPYINDKEVTAIATYVAWVMKYKQALISGDKTSMALALSLELRWYRLVDEARCPEELDLNDMHEIANAKSSWNRKSYGKSYFPLLK